MGVSHALLKAATRGKSGQHVKPGRHLVHPVLLCNIRPFCAQCRGQSGNHRCGKKAQHQEVHSAVEAAQGAPGGPVAFATPSAFAEGEDPQAPRNALGQAEDEDQWALLNNYLGEDLAEDPFGHFGY